MKRDELLGRGQCCTITLLYINRLNETEFAIFVSLMCSLPPKDLHSELIFTSTTRAAEDRAIGKKPNVVPKRPCQVMGQTGLD